MGPGGNVAEIVYKYTVWGPQSDIFKDIYLVSSYNLYVIYFSDKSITKTCYTEFYIWQFLSLVSITLIKTLSANPG